MTNEEHWRRNFTSDICCPVYGREARSIEHVYRNYFAARKVWAVVWDTASF